MQRCLALVVVVILAACGSQPTGLSPASPPASASTSASASRPSSGAVFDLLPPPAGPPAIDLGITCSLPIGAADPVAIVQLHDGTTVLRDYADVAHPVTACSFGTQTGLQLIDARHIVFSHGFNQFAVVDLPQVRAHWFQLPESLDRFLAIAPDLGTVAWLSPDFASNTDKVHLTTQAGDKVVASLPNPHGGRCGSPEDSRIAGYSHSGTHLFVLDQPIPNLNSLLVLAGDQVALRIAPDSGNWPAGAQPAMAVWSPTTDTLYYRKGGDAWTWAAATGALPFLPGVSWYDPTISPDGHHLAFAQLQTDSLHTVSMVDLPMTSRPIQLGNGRRNLPVFLNARQLWFKSDNPGPCGSGGNQSLIYDLSDGSESPSIIDWPVAIWPATSSNY